MNNNDLIKLASQFGNVLAYDPNKPVPAGFKPMGTLSAANPNGLKVTTFYNDQTDQIAVAIAGTNDLKDVLGYPSLYLGYGSNKAQINEATVLFDKIKKFAEEKNATVFATGHSFAGLFVDMAAGSYGFQGVKFDGVGGNSVLKDQAYQNQLQSLGVNGFFTQVFGGGLDMIKNVSNFSRFNILNCSLLSRLV